MSNHVVTTFNVPSFVRCSPNPQVGKIISFVFAGLEYSYLILSMAPLIVLDNATGKIVGLE